MGCFRSSNWCNESDLSDFHELRQGLRSVPTETETLAAKSANPEGGQADATRSALEGEIGLAQRAYQLCGLSEDEVKKRSNLVLKWKREKYILSQVVLYRIIPKHRGETHAILQKS
jgi:hypothetical protein